MSDVAASRSGRFGLRVFFVLFAIFLYAPVMLLALFSFNDSRVVSFPFRGVTLQWYREFAANTQLLGALRLSALVATASSLIAVGLGVMAAFAMVRRRFPAKGAVSGLLLSPLVIPYLVFGIALLILFRAIDTVSTDIFGTYIGLGVHAIVIGHVVVSMPYTILTIVPRLQHISVSLDEAAHDLGAGSLQTFGRVTLPLLRPAIVSAFLIAFTLSFDEYAIASFLAGTEATYPIYLFSQLRTRARLPQMIAVSVIVLAVSMTVIVATEVVRRRAERKLALEESGLPI
jgi:spermidine/putrescine transport system permease protein